jgi:hypothetical protein
MISEFIYTGSFHDPFNEFFIEKLNRRSKKSHNEVYLFKLTDDSLKIPSFIGQ